MSKLPFCRQCMYFGGKVKDVDIYGETVWKGICKHEKGGVWEHILDQNNWCINGKFKTNPINS